MRVLDSSIGVLFNHFISRLTFAGRKGLQPKFAKTRCLKLQISEKLSNFKKKQKISNGTPWFKKIVNQIRERKVLCGYVVVL